MAVKQQVVVEGKSLALTNLDKVLYPGNGFTKAQVIDYYIKVSKFLLPHFARRPVTLNRFPDGVGGKAFYEKDAPDYLPSWAHTTNVPRVKGGEPIRYICIDDLPTLVWCANVASLELHPFLHRAEDLDCPTSIVFDLDPGEGVDLVACAEVAFLLKALLEKNSLECFAKVSGSKGLQIYVPLNTRVTYEKTRAAAETVAGLLARGNPKLVVSEMAKQLRRGKVFIDWSQNSDFKTTVGVYSLRAKHDVPYVSAPVTWAELQGLLKKKNPELLRFEPEALIKRLDKVGDLFTPLLTLRQNLALITEEGTRTVAKPSKTVEATKSNRSLSPKLSKAVAPSFIEPMLLLKTGKLPEGEDWLYEIKLDGFRALATKSGGAVSFRSRNDKDFGEKFGEIVDALKRMPDETVIDGELVA
jgi:bifunctional non-homologous end joining protein LigD